MDVRCNRCGTEYEFDDDLISDRGTTVQCTNCGYQFKIYPERTAVVSPERWVVRLTTGREHVYTSLRDLQRAIGDRKVGPKDLLSRGNQPARPLGAIPELEPFFAGATGQSHGMQSAPRTLHGVAPPATGAAPRPQDVRQPAPPTRRGFSAPGVERGTSSPNEASRTGEFSQQSAPSRVLGVDPTAATERRPPADEPPAAPAGRTTKPGMGSTQRAGTLPDPARPIVHVKAIRVDSSPPPNFDATMPAASAPRVDPNAATVAPTPAAPKPLRPERPAGPPNLDATMPVPSQPGGMGGGRLPSERAAAAFAAAAAPLSSGQSSASPVRSSPRGAPAPEPPPVSTRDRVPSYDEIPLEDSVDPARRARSRWIAGVVFLAVAGLLGATLGRQYLVRLSTGQKTEPAHRDDRTVRFLQEGMRLLDQGDFEGAQEQLAKAQALSDRDPGVLAALARAETVRADVEWLKLRLLDPTAQDSVQSTTRELTKRAGRARQAVDAAFAVVADDPMVVRSRIDAMRIAGEEGKAREWIAPIAANASDPQNAYVLAALDLSETAPAFGTVIDRLRAAAVSEKESLRARGALIYALVRAGRGVEAETELAKVTGG
ncbi:MAG TPA: zinc-ribbon domain-containing protein, partial [Polyangiaceae bacterium]|nr:zinc-ribbon domain-containing protein [Polyangiaceae bacterium]